MNVTTVGQEMALIQLSKYSETEDAEAFSQELKKQLTHANDIQEKDSKDDLSQSELESDSKGQSEDKDAEDAFVIVPTFFRFDHASEALKTVLSDIHIDKEIIESTAKMDVSESLQTSETPAVEQLQSAEMQTVEQDKRDSNVSPVLESKLIRDSIDLDYKDTTQINNTDRPIHAENKTSDKTDAFIDLVLNETSSDSNVEKTLTEKLDAYVKEAQVFDTKRMIEESPLFSNENSTLANSAELLEHLINSKDIESMDYSSLRDLEGTFKQVEMSQTIESKESEGNDASTSAQMVVNQNVQATEQSNSISQMTSPETATQVTLEESPEIIQDLMMTVASNEAGDKVYESTITLTPETLGEIKVEMTYSDEGLKGRLIFETEEAKQWVESQWQQMSRPLELNGIKMEGFDFQVVNHQDFMQTTNFNFSQQSDQSKREQQEKRKESHLVSNTLEEEAAVNKAIVRSGNGLNYYA